MKVFLLQHKEFHPPNLANKSTNYDLVSVPIPADYQSKLVKKRIANLKAAVEKMSNENKWEFSITFSIAETSTNVLDVTLNGPLLEILHGLTEGNVRFTFKVDIMDHWNQLITSLEGVPMETEINEDNKVVAKCSKDGWKTWENLSYGALTIQMISDSDWFLDFGSPLETINIFRKMLKQSILTDFHIVAANREEIPCHKAVLAAHSDELAAMIISGMKESLSLKMELKRVGRGKDGTPISKEGVQAFLEFLYSRQCSRAVRSSLVALELLELGHQYRIFSMESVMKEIIIEKSHERVDVDIALQIFFHSRSREGHDDLKDKVVQVLKLKFDELENSELYKELYPEETSRQLFEWTLLKTMA